MLELDGQTYLIAVADCHRCGTWRFVECAFGGKLDYPTLTNTYGATCPTTHRRATLWPERVFRAHQRQMERVQ